MSHVYADRVLETTTTTGTGDITVAGALTGFGALSARLSVGDTFDYTIFAVDGSAAPTGDWETGVGTYTASNQFSRSVRQSSNSDALVNFASGTKHVAITLIAPQLSAIAAGTWRTLYSWDHSATGNVVSPVVSDITTNEILIMLDDCIVSISPPTALNGTIAVQVSTDNGSSFIASTSYVAVNPNNLEAGDDYLRSSTATSTTARSSLIHIHNAQASGVPKFATTNGDHCFMPGITSPINAVRIQARTTSSPLTFISGKIWVLGR